MGQIDSKKFFLGKLFDGNNKLTDEKLLYNPADLNTHCVILGMTGSGKTGLGILTLEEIALKGIPAIILDPKGDLTNLLLHFSDMKGEDIAPWLDQEAPARAGMDLQTYADEKAVAWVKGLESYGYTSEDIEALKQVDYTIFTPGSTNGNPIDIMATFAAPERLYNCEDENLRDEITTSVTALLGLVGMNNIDPIKSKEHIFLSNLVQYYWSIGKDVTLVDMIEGITEPPFKTLGALPLEKVYPTKERMDLAMQINNFLASPTFKSWNLGPGLNIGNLIRNKDGKPRFNIFYMQHLSDQERMFFVTMFYSQIESWMRTQTGTGNLRLVVYFDEMAGYVPPSSSPSSKAVILRMLKQARAYGVGLILSSQNPIDIDYKGLSNAGTWFIGHLQTEQDKNRLLDGLSLTEGEINRNKADKLISSLGKRSFLYMNIHEPGLKVMSTRWTINFLAGPLTRNLIPELYRKGLCVPYSEKDALAAEKARAGITEEEEAAAAEAELIEMEKKKMERPNIPATINEYFVETAKRPADCDADPNEKITYLPVWIAQAEVRAEKAKYNFRLSVSRAAEINDENIRGNSIRWDDYECDPKDLDQLTNRPETNDADYQQPPAWMMDAKLAKTYEGDFVNWIYRDASMTINSNEKLGIFMDKSVGDDIFYRAVQEKIEEGCLEEIEKVQETFAEKLTKIANKIEKAEMVLSTKETQKKMKGLELVGGLVELGVGLFGGGRKRSVSTSLSKVGQISNTKKAAEKAELDLENLVEEKEALEAKLEKAIEEIRERWNKFEDANTETRISVTKSNIFVDAFGICWMPYYKNSVGKLVRAF